jgi:hypothetical protein
VRARRSNAVRNETRRSTALHPRAMRLKSAHSRDVRSIRICHVQRSEVLMQRCQQQGSSSVLEVDFPVQVIEAWIRGNSDLRSLSTEVLQHTIQVCV